MGGGMIFLACLWSRTVTSLVPEATPVDGAIQRISHKGLSAQNCVHSEMLGFTQL